MMHAWLKRKMQGWGGSGLDVVDRRGLRALKGRYRGRRVFVIGNGPSLNDTDLAPLRDEVTIGSNGIFLLFDRMGFRPTLYTVEDTLVAEDRAAVINGLRGMTKVFPNDLRYCIERDADTVFINFCRPGYVGFPRFSDNFERRVYWGGTVTFLNLQLAWFMGASAIYLVGLDHSYRKPVAGDAVVGNVISSGSADDNHFHPDYFGPGFRYHDPMVERMETGYRKAREFLEARGCPVFNATVGGRLEVFPRVSLPEVVK